MKERPRPPQIQRFRRCDVRPILAQGGEPLPEIRRRLDRVEAGEGLLVMAPFLPSPLIEVLGGEGWLSRVERGRGADWLVYFWRSS